MAKNSFIIYTEYMEHIEMLDMEQRGILMTALMCYQMEQELPEMDGMTKMCFSFIKARVDRDNEAYQEKCRKNAENGAKGGRPKKANGFEEKRTVSEKANGFSENPTKPKKADTDTDIDTDIKEKVSPKGDTKKKSTQRFSPPTVAQVKKFCDDHGYHLDAQRFVDYYTSNGWRVGRNKMKDWQAAARNWAKKNDTVVSGTKFSNYQSERRTDYDDIERRLIAQSMGG